MRRLKDHTIVTCLLDSAHDAYPIYDLLDAWNIEAIIDLNKRATGNAKYQGPLTLTKDGIPICPAGHVMAYHGFCRDRQRHKWRCPLTRKTWKVVCDSPCSPSSYGRVIYTYEKDNLRLFTRTPRGSKAWRKSIRGVRRWSGRLSVRKLTIVWRLPGPGAQRCGSFAALPWPCASMLMLGLLMRKWILGRLFKDGLGKAR